MTFLMILMSLVCFTVGMGFLRSYVAAESMEDWRAETTVTWRATLEQLNRIEGRQRHIIRELREYRTKGD